MVLLVAACHPVLTVTIPVPSQLSRHNKSLQQLLKPVKRIQEEEEEGISSMVWRGTAPTSCSDPTL